MAHFTFWSSIFFSLIKSILLGWTMLNHVEPCWTMLNQVEPCWTMFNHVQPCSTMSNHVEPRTRLRFASALDLQGSCQLDRPPWPPAKPWSLWHDPPVKSQNDLIGNNPWKSLNIYIYIYMIQYDISKKSSPWGFRISVYVDLRLFLSSCTMFQSVSSCR